MSNDNNSAFSWLFKSGIFVAIAGVLYFFFNQGGAPATPEPQAPPTQTEHTTNTTESTTPSSTYIADTGLEEYLPAAIAGGQLVRHKYFTLSYNEDHEQADWVVYRITRERLNNSTIERTNQFLPDPLVKTESATNSDYNGSGYDRGHLCPAADMAFDAAAMSESFYMSNMSPQDQKFNGGIWRELEELTRDWGRKYEKIIVVAGPVLKDGAAKSIGFSKVSVPKRYFRVILTKDKTIGFLLPNQLSDKHVMDYACAVDVVEKATGLDFFPKVLSGLNEELEALYDRNAWPVKEERYQKRVVDWNVR
jgi:endonuclease G, mitochondrial